MNQPAQASDSPTLKIAVVVPCFNEAQSVAKVVTEFRGALPSARIVVVDNGSTDRTGEIAHAAGAEIVRETRRGKGFALLPGLPHAAPADLFLVVDCHR